MKELHPPEEKTVRVPPGKLKEMVAGIFQKLGLPLKDARICADALVYADLVGMDSHGVSNYIELLYLPGLREGSINPRPRIQRVHETSVTAVLDGDGGMGFVVGTRAMGLAIQKAEETGVGLVTVRNSRHYGTAGYYALMALAHDMIGLSMTSSDRFVVPTFGRERRLGTNPISVAVPAAGEPPFLLDMATSTVPRGKIVLARREGVKLPEGWAADPEGQPTTDPKVADESKNLLPLGGTYEGGSHKGYGLAVLVEILSAVLSGGDMSLNLGLRIPVGHFFGAIRIDAFRPVEAFKSTMDGYLRMLRHTPPIESQERVYYAGLIEHETKKKRSREGIPLHEEVVAYLRGLAAELGVGEQI